MMSKRLLSLLMILCVSVSAMAQETACDPEYYKSLKSRAWLEAQREITQNQNLIFKPDSVFEYTCFDLYLNELAHHAKDMFSETLRWGPIPNVHNNGTEEPTSMDKALEALTGVPLKAYIQKNFEDRGDGRTYNLLGGRAYERQDSSGTVTEPSIDHQFQQIDGREATGRNEYNCNVMNLVWMRAKCMDFIDRQEHDGFFTFEEYKDYAAEDKDHRFLPQMCEALARWDPEIKEAYVNNAGNESAEGTPWVEVEVTSFLDSLENCGTPIKTGLSVYINGEGYDEAICLAPGCYHNVRQQRCTQ